MTTERSLQRAAGLLEKGTLGFIAGAAAAVGIIEIVVLVQRVIGLATDRVVDVTMPLTEPAAPDLVGGVVQAATIDSVTLSVEGLPAGGRAWLILWCIASLAIGIAIAGLLVWLCLRLFVGRPFVRSATWGIGGLAILVMACGIGGSMALGRAQSIVAGHVGGDTYPFFAVEVDLNPIGWGLALAVVAGAFELGQRLQRDTEGLV